ncbi:hypothetical protein WG906_10740 [Pedobacter sp. P351]|uniref:hypothetical protein n=1 Tax=Pedobacter superstes TaxID=3133441 RepID=UPI003096F334
MISQLEREELAKIILSTDNENLINQIKDLLLQSHSWANLPTKVQNDLNTSIEELEAGLGIPHEEVMKDYKKWL